MSTKTITITDEAYNRLKSAKDEGDSFTDAIMKLTKKNPLDALVGILTKEDANELRENIKGIRRKMDERVAETAKRLE